MMKLKAIIRMLLVAVMTALLLASSEASLAVGQSLAVAADSPCDNICVDASCVPVPVEWLGPIPITDTFIIYPTSACLCENEDGSYRIEGEGEFFLPNIQTSQGTEGIYVKFVMDVVSLVPTLELEPQCVQFTGTWEEGVPIGESGFLLTSMEGEVIFEPEPSVQVTGTIESEQQMPDDGPAVTGEGTLWVSLEEPHEVSFEGTLTVFAIHAVQAALTLDQSWGFAGSVMLTAPGCDGGAFLHVWEEGDGVYGFAGSASLTCTIEADSLTPEGWPDWLPGIPAEDITVTADGELGEFCLACDAGQCVEETYGVWAGTALDLSLPESVVEPGTITARFFVSSTGILSATTNLERCETIADCRMPNAECGNIPMANLGGDKVYSPAMFCLNQPPSITITSPSTSEEPGSGSYTIRWTADDPDDEAVVSLYYDRDGTGRDGRLIAHCLSEGEGSYVWDTSEVGSGIYYVYGRIDDGKNLAVVSYSAGTVKVDDSTAPAAPSAPSVSLEDGVAELSWEASMEDDVIGYEVYYGPEPDAYTGSYDATNVTSFRLPQKPSPETAYMAVSAYDSSGNSSPLSEEVRLWFVYLPVVLKNQH
ncbi:MAG: hypothetical protein WBW48_04525 [Anaerolineae bacterium]